jgi:DNA-binding NtrC family response regulator
MEEMTHDINILVVDDEKSMRDSLADWLGLEGYFVDVAESGRAAIDMARRRPWNIFIIDLKMPGMDGIQTMKEIKAICGDIPVLLITAYATIDTAVLSMKEGATDYVVKPVNPQELSLIISRIVEKQDIIRENLLLRKELEKSYQIQDIISKNSKMQELFKFIHTVADSKSTILIEGQSGTGKELVARAIHNLSPRKDAPFVSISTGALSESLIESELFGHEKGAFTDAKFLKKGKIELADAGTLFLDEIGDISPKTQVDLLRVLQEKEIQRVGGSELIRVDVRFIAATNRELKKLVDEGRFREDLYYRLNVINISLPPLKERKEDIPLLCFHFLKKFTIETKKNVDRISEEAMRLLMEHDWPGNIRELQNTVERAVVVCKEDLIQAKDLPSNITGEAPQALQPNDLTLDGITKQHIIHVLRENNWNIQLSAKILGIDRVTLYRKIEKLDIQRKS